ncbi:hypothetical protein SVAN01_05782 [Stagonosporopsis vannaccii]|nr:hypothetical protein SVAN01_05782 [Stagonosporopsis vannaccii]
MQDSNVRLPPGYNTQTCALDTTLKLAPSSYRAASLSQYRPWETPAKFHPPRSGSANCRLPECQSVALTHGTRMQAPSSSAAASNPSPSHPDQPISTHPDQPISTHPDFGLIWTGPSWICCEPRSVSASLCEVMRGPGPVRSAELELKLAARDPRFAMSVHALRTLVLGYRNFAADTVAHAASRHSNAASCRTMSRQLAAFAPRAERGQVLFIRALADAWSFVGFGRLHPVDDPRRNMWTGKLATAQLTWKCISSRHLYPKSASPQRPPAYKPRCPSLHRPNVDRYVVSLYLHQQHSDDHPSQPPCGRKRSPHRIPETQHHGPPSHSHSLPPHCKRTTADLGAGCTIQLDPERDCNMHRHPSRAVSPTTKTRSTMVQRLVCAAALLPSFPLFSTRLCTPTRCLQSSLPAVTAARRSAWKWVRTVDERYASARRPTVPTQASRHKAARRCRGSVVGRWERAEQARAARKSGAKGRDWSLDCSDAVSLSVCLSLSRGSYPRRARVKRTSSRQASDPVGSATALPRVSGSCPRLSTIVPTPKCPSQYPNPYPFPYPQPPAKPSPHARTHARTRARAGADTPYKPGETKTNFHQLGTPFLGSPSGRKRSGVSARPLDSGCWVAETRARLVLAGRMGLWRERADACLRLRLVRKGGGTEAGQGRVEIHVLTSPTPATSPSPPSGSLRCEAFRVHVGRARALLIEPCTRPATQDSLSSPSHAANTSAHAQPRPRPVTNPPQPNTLFRTLSSVPLSDADKSLLQEADDYRAPAPQDSRE